MKTFSVLLLICLVEIIYGRDFYFGLFQKNDFLVAADELYKPRSPSRITSATYGRIFKCPITYFRVVDRLGSNSNPRVQIVRGGIQKKYIVVRLSVYDQPISVNIYIGCTNKNHVRPGRGTKAAQNATASSSKDGDKVPDSTVAGAEGDTNTDKPAGESQTDANQEPDKDNGNNEENKEGEPEKVEENAGDEAPA